MVTPTIYPQEAAGDGCTAYVTLYDSHSPESGSGWYNGYTATATAAEGWIFDGWECDADTSSGPDSSGSTSPTWTCDSYSFEGISEYDRTYSWGSRSYRTVTRLVAKFKQEKSYKITVTTSASPSAGGTTSPTSETREGYYGQSETFNLVAQPEDGYEFKRWENQYGALVSKSKTTSVTHTYIYSDQTFDYTAIYRKLTGLILRNDSGTILHGAGGSILRDD